IHAKKIVSDHGNINLNTSGSGSSVITVNNGTQTALSAANGSVNLFTSGNTHFGGNITVTGNITGQSVGVTARGLGASGGKINITGNVTATGGNSTDLTLFAFDTLGNGAVHVTGNLTAARGITVQTEGGVGDLSVTGAIHGGTQAGCHTYCVQMQASNGVLHAGGDVTATRQNVSFAGSSLTFGNVTAADEIDMNAHTTANAGANIIQRAGTTLKAARVQIDLNASYGGLVSLSNVTASSANGPAGIEIVTRA